MDEACYVLNSDAYGRLKYKKMMQQFMEEVEKMLPMLQEHPIINEIALRMSFYAYRMDDYERCKKYYEEYRRIRLLGFNNLVLLKRFMCKDEASGNEKAHVWFIFPDFEWKIDIAYNNITEDDETDRIFFVSGQHPMENGLSRFFSKKSAQERLGIPMVQTGTFGLGNFTEGEQEEIQKICDIIESHLPETCSTIEELILAYGDVMVPVGAEN